MSICDFAAVGDAIALFSHDVFTVVLSRARIITPQSPRFVLFDNCMRMFLSETNFVSMVAVVVCEKVDNCIRVFLSETISFEIVSSVNSFRA